MDQIGFVDGRHGLLGSDPQELAQAVIKLAADNGLARRAGEAGRALMEAHRWSRVTAGAEDLHSKWVWEFRHSSRP